MHPIHTNPHTHMFSHQFKFHLFFLKSPEKDIFQYNFIKLQKQIQTRIKGKKQTNIQHKINTKSHSTCI